MKWKRWKKAREWKVRRGEGDNKLRGSKKWKETRGNKGRLIEQVRAKEEEGRKQGSEGRKGRE